MVTFLKDNPRRPSDWRWQHASSMVEDGAHLNRKRDDTWVRKAVHFLRALNNCDTDLQRRTLAESNPEMFWAHDIYQSEGDPGVGPFTTLRAWRPKTRNIGGSP